MKGFELLWIREEYEEPVTLYLVSSRKVWMKFQEIPVSEIVETPKKANMTLVFQIWLQLSRSKIFSVMSTYSERLTNLTKGPWSQNMNEKKWVMHNTGSITYNS